MRAHLKITIQEDRHEIPVFVKEIVLEEGKVIAYDCDKDGHISFLLELEKIEQRPEVKAHSDKPLGTVIGKGAFIDRIEEKERV